MPEFYAEIFFVERVTNVCNSLPKNVDFSSLSKFKNSVSQTDFSLYLKTHLNNLLDLKCTLDNFPTFHDWDSG